MAFDCIREYPIEPESVDGGRQLISMPAEFSILGVGIDPSGTMCLWAIVDSDYLQRDVEIRIVGTGKPLPHVGSYIGTVTHGSFVWHVFTGPSDSSNRQQEFHFATRGNDGRG